MSIDFKKEIADTSGQNEFSSIGWQAQHYRVRSSDIEWSLGVEPLLLFKKELVEVVRASDKDTSWTPPIRSFPGMSN